MTDSVLTSAPGQEIRLIATSLPRNAIPTTKKLLKRGNAPAISETLGEEAQHFRVLRQSETAPQAFRAFMSR